MPPIESLEAPSTASTKSVDVPVVKSGNLSTGQAAVQLLAMSQKQNAEQQKPAHQATEQVPAVEKSETTTPIAEVPATSESAPAEETPVATTETPAQPEAEADTVPSQNPFTPEQQEIFNKRLGKEIAKTKAIQEAAEQAKSRIAELEAKLSQVATPADNAQTPPQTPIVVSADQPLSEHQDLTSLQNLQKTAKSAMNYVEEVLDDPAQWRTMKFPDGQGGEQDVKVHQIADKFYTEQDLRKQMRKARDIIQEQIPARTNFLVARNAAQQKAFTDFPFLKDKTSPEYQMAQAAKRDPANAVIMAQPNADWIIGVQIMGLKALQAQQAAAKAKAEAPVVKPKPVQKPSSDQTAVSAPTGQSRQSPALAATQRQAQAIKDSLKKGNINPVDAAKLLKFN